MSSGFGRERTGERVEAQVKHLQASEATETRRDFLAEPVGAEVECLQEGEVPDGGESSLVSPAPCKFSATTLSASRRLHVTPSQLQKLALLFQEASVPELPSLTCTLKASSAALSPAAAITAGIIRVATSEARRVFNVQSW